MATWETVYFNQFDTTGDYTVLGPEWEVYSADPGNAGFGVRSQGVVNVVASAQATSGANVLRLAALDVGGQHFHSGVKLLLPHVYMQAELRVRVDDDPDEVTSGVVIFWPTADPVRFPDSANASGTEGEWPAGGELDFWESFDDRDTRTPVRSFIHRLNPAATPPYDAADDEVVANVPHYWVEGDAGSGGVDQSDWHKIVCSWTPDEVYIEIDNGPKRTIIADPASIPDWPMELTLQIDAWSDTPPSATRNMEIDYVLLRSYTPPPASFPNATLDLRVEMALTDADTDPSAWTWTDMSDRLIAQEVALTKGRADESAQTQPSSVTFELDNNDGALTPGNQLSALYPNVHRGNPVRVSVEGARPALVLPGATGAYASCPDSAALDITGDVDIRIRLQPDRWAVSSGIQRLVNKWATNDLSYGLAVGNTGQLYFDWSTDGTTGLLAESTAIVAALQPIWLAAALDVNDGAGGLVLTYYRFDGADAPDDLAEWDLVQTVTGAFTTSVHAGGGALEVGSRLGGTEANFPGSVLQVQVRDGINGTLVADPDFTAQDPGTTTFFDSVGNTWTVHGAAEITTRATRFVGTVDAISLTWPYGDHNAGSSVADSEARAMVTAAGMLRRLGQGGQPLRSPLFRSITGPSNTSALLGYWPCEDDNRAVHLASGLEGHASAVASINDAIDTANDDTLEAAAPLPTIPGGESGEWTATVPITGSAAAWSVQMFCYAKTLETNPTRTPLFNLTTGGTAARWSVELSDTTARVQAENAGGVSLLDVTGAVSGLEDAWFIVRLDVEQDGANIDWQLGFIPVDVGTLGAFAGTFTGTNGPVQTVSNTATAPTDGLSFGHIVVSDGSLSVGWLTGADTAWSGETAAHRFWRLCQEEGIEVEVIGDPTLRFNTRGDLAYSEPMGPQRRDSLLALLRDCAHIETGFLMERRRSPGLVFRTRRSMEGQAVGLALDASVKGHLNPPFEPVLDDQRLRNDVTVSTNGGSSARAVDQSSIDVEGLYEIDVPINGVGGHKIQNAILATQTGLTEHVAGQNLHQAQRRLSLLSSDRLRYPYVGFDLGTALDLRTAWLDLELGDRVTVSNLPAQHPAAAVELIFEHVNERISNVHWRPQLTCSPGTHWLSPWPPLTAAESGPLAVSATSAAVGVDPQAVSNPIQNAGGTLLAIAVATGPSNEAIPPGAWTAPPGGTQVFDYGGVDFVPRARAWTIVEDGSATYTFGFDTSAGNPCTCLLIGLDGSAGTVLVTSTPVVAGGSVSTPYPQLGTQVDDLVVAVGISQITDEMTAGPSGYTEAFNNTDTQSPRGIAAHSALATGSLTTPGNSTWDGSVGGHIQFVFGFRGEGSGGSGNAPLAASSWTVYIDPEDPDTYNANRTDGQLIVAGNRFQVGSGTDDVNAGSGYGLSFDAASEIHSFSEASDTFRFGARPVAGLFHTSTGLVARHVWRNDGSYDESQETAGGQNNSTTWPGIDRTYFDGTRTQISEIPNDAADPKAIRGSLSGETGDRVLQSSVFRIEQWMLAADDNAATGGSHASGSAPSPWTCFIGDKALTIVTRDQTTAWSTSNNNPTNTTRATVPITASDVGDWWGLVYDYTIDPNDGHLHVYLNKGDGQGAVQIVDVNGGYGLAYADTDPNQDLWYVLLGPHYYSWHRFTNDPTNAPNNWDDTYGAVRELAIGYSGVIVAPSGVDVADVISHCNYYIDG